ncbi:MAG: hypothetical protein BMS9Abin26_0228 [Gammaproteobacteria bacterium]|nr:MAG: hypothetical protein BMS9Abin26_0228 [Gammaproteobacteria bacterium]
MELFLVRTMKQSNGPLKWVVTTFISACIFFLLTGIAAADIPYRVSVKFILDSNGNRPASGDINTNAEVNDQIDLGNEVLRNMFSELGMGLVEIVNIAGVSQHFNDAINGTNRDQIRSDALGNTALYAWRTNAINMYIVGSSGSAISKFPPNNDIIMVGQNIRTTTVIHESGHSLNLMHTHEGGGADGCADTIPDNKDWTIDQLSTNQYGVPYASLTAAQQNVVDMVFNNIMSYHGPRDRLSPCQMDRMSNQGYSDRSWMYSKIPVYVSTTNLCPLLCNGSWVFPYNNVQTALSGGGLTGKGLVLKQGNYSITQNAINFDLEIISRSGTSKIDKDEPLYTLPVINESQAPGVSTAAKAAQQEDTAARKVVSAGEKNAKSAMNKVDRTAILNAAEVKRKQHSDNAMNYLLEAESYASGDEKLAAQLELAQRYRYAGNCGLAIKYYNLVAKGTDQKHLKARALRLVEKCKQASTADNSANTEK